MKSSLIPFIFSLLLLVVNQDLVSQNTQNSDIKESVKFVAFGHSYAVIGDEARAQILIEAINNEDVDYVFILGDCDIYNRDYFNIFKNGLNSSVFFSPGNHDLTASTYDQYLDNVGYLNKFVRDSLYNFILLNSSDSIANINNFLKEELNLSNNRKTNVILTHHRIWDDNILSPEAFSHDKSFLFREIEDQFLDQIDYIIAGNSPRQYFGTQYCDQQHKNSNVIFWADIVNGINCYSIGMTNNLNYVVGELINNRLAVYPKSIQVNKRDVENSLPVERPNGIVSGILKVVESKKFWFGLILGLLGALLMIKLIKRK